MLSISAAGVTSNDRVLETLFHDNFDRVFGFARRRLDEADAADITADVFHAATAAIRRGELVGRSWLMAVARNKVFDHWRRSYLRRTKAHLVARAEDGAVWPAESHDDPRQPAVNAALEALNDRHRSLLLLHHVDGFTIADLAAATGDSESAIESALARARKRFAVLYEEFHDE